MNKVSERFLEYVKIDTQSDPNAESMPTTIKQKDLGRLLVKQMSDIGLTEVSIDDNGYVFGTLPSNIDREVPVLGFIAHMDTAPDYSGKNVKPQIIEGYNGMDIVLNKEKNMTMGIKEFPSLMDYIGQDLIVTDGTTLLGADNKAGIAEIMTAMEHLVQHPEIKHGKLRVGFTVDEEVGKGADAFDVKDFGANFAYTIDGGKLGEIEYENFNAASALITIKGKSIHPGAAKNKMLNATRVAMAIDTLLTDVERPEFTEGYEGFYHLHDFEGNVSEAKLHYIIRDHDMVLFEEKKERLIGICELMKVRYPKAEINLEIEDSYYNMKEKIEPHMHLVDTASQVMASLGIEPITVPIRGGTDGARLSYEGLPCPNLCTGGHNFHGPYEYVSIQSMEKVCQIIVEISKAYGYFG